MTDLNPEQPEVGYRVVDVVRRENEQLRLENEQLREEIERLRADRDIYVTFGGAARRCEL